MKLLCFFLFFWFAAAWNQLLVVVIIIVVAVFVFSLYYTLLAVIVVVVAVSSAVCLLACHRQSLRFGFGLSAFTRASHGLLLLLLLLLAAGAANFTQISNAFSGLHLLRADKYLLISASQTPPSTHVETHTYACAYVRVCVYVK